MRMYILEPLAKNLKFSKKKIFIEFSISSIDVHQLINFQSTYMKTHFLILHTPLILRAYGFVGKHHFA